MFQTRKEVDAHVHKILGKLQPGSERDVKGLAIARLYNKVQEYPKAIEYLNGYLRTRDDAVGHNLIATCYSRQNPPDEKKALQHYQRSIQINPRQAEVVVDACELLLKENNALSTESAKFWLDQATSLDLGDNQYVFSLRMRVNLMESNGNAADGEDNTLEMLMHKELQARPQDVNVRVQLLRSYVEKKKFEQAFNYALKTELESKGCTSQSIDWYEMVWMVIVKLEMAKDVKKNWRFWHLALHALDRLVQLILEKGSGLAEVSNQLFRLDQYLYKFSHTIEMDAPQREFHQSCADHYTGQLLLHAVTLIFKREVVANKNKWMSTLRSALPLLLLGYQVRPLEDSSVHHWMKHCDAEQKQIIQIWRPHGAFRCAQLGRTLLGCLDRSRMEIESHRDNDNINEEKMSGNLLPGLFGDSEELLASAHQQCSDKSWRSQLYQQLFTHGEHKLKDTSSHLVRNPRLQLPIFEWPNLAHIETYEQQALVLPPQSLAHHVYLALGTDPNNLGDAPRVVFYEGLRRDVKQNLNYCGHDSISQVDVDLYLYAAVIQTRRKLQLQREAYDSTHLGNRNAAARPHMMPFANLVGQLAAPEQSNWWDLVVRLNSNQLTGEGNRAEQRAQLQTGLEAVRGVNGPKTDPIIIFQLGKILNSRSDSSSLETRIDTLYRHGFSILRRQHTQQLDSYIRVFKYGSANSTAAWQDLQSLAEEAVTYFSAKMFKIGQYEQFLDEVRGLDLPMALYMQSEACRHLEDSSKLPRSSRVRYSERRQECLQQTQKLIRNDVKHPLTSAIQREIRRSQQERNSRGIDDSFGSPDVHNNSSAYEDAEDDFYSIAAFPANRSRRQVEVTPVTPIVVAQPSQEMEQTVKQISKSLCVLKDDVSVGMEAMRQEIKALTEKFTGLEELLKKIKISSRDTPTRDVDPAAALGLDDLFIIEDALAEHQQQQQQQQQQSQNQGAVHPVVPNPYTPGFYNGVPNTPSAQDRFLPGPYGSPMFNQNQMYNYYAAQAQAQAQAQFLRTPPAPGSIPPPNMFGPRNPNFGLPSMFPPPTVPSVAPYIDAMGNFTQPPPSLIPPPAQPAAPAPPLNILESKPVGALPTPGFFNTSTPGFGVSPIQVPQSKPLSVPTGPIPGTAPAPPNAAAVNPAATTAVPPPIHVPQVAPSVPAPVPAPVSVPSMFNRALNNQPVEKEPPANVVITSSDPLPKPTTASVQPTLSVTIPAQHIKPSLVQAPEQPAQPAQAAQPSVPAVGAFSFNFGSKTSESPFSFKTQVAKAAAEKQKEQEEAELNQSAVSDLNKTLPQDTSADDYDPRPDFKPIIPLPDEVEVRTGEEGEEVKFTNRAKLFRYADKEWKERGTGVIKILCDKATGVSRVLMRRDQTHKVCANHKITADITINVASQDKDKKSLLWAANDFADEQVTLEKFLVRFKTGELAEEFRVAFTNASEAAKSKETVKSTEKTAELPKTDKESTATAPAAFSLPKSFVTSTPAANSLFNKPQEQTKPQPKPDPAATAAKSLFAAPATAAPASAAPFASFSFGANGTSGFGTSNASPFANLSFGSASAVGSGNNTTLFTTALIKDNTVQGQTPQQSQLNKSNASDADDEYVPTAQFAPVIALPELVEVVTGEENEDVLFEHRAKLLLWDREANEWKERGLGNMKLLRDRTDPSQIRLLMRREQVHKLCCNQRLLPEIKFSYASNIKAAVTWGGQDYSDEELTTALLAVRFKSQDVCQEFFEAVQKAQQSIGKEPKKEKAASAAGENVKEKEKPIKGFGDAFKPKAGSWDCQACYTSNGQDQLYCLACQEPKDATVPPKQSGLDQGNALNLTTGSSNKFSFGFAPAALPATGGFSFGAATQQNEKPVVAVVTASVSAPTAVAPAQAAALGFGKPSTTSGFGDAFKPAVGSWSCNECYVNNPGESLYCSACQAPKNDTVPKKENSLGTGLNLPASTQYSFGFGAPAASNKDKTADGANKTSNVFGSATFNFAAPAMPAAVAPATSIGSSSFSFSMPKPGQQQPKSPAANEGDDNELHVEEEENNTYFAPVIPLPDKIDVKTGEEDEETLYVQRAKLYRLTEGEWKERGLGDVKILRHRQTKKLRVVMRREQVFKICLNHVLNENVVYREKTETSWMFAVHDFSEGESVLERFTLRFKNKEVAQGFHEAVKNALNGTAKAIEDAPDSKSAEATKANSSSNEPLKEKGGEANSSRGEPEVLVGKTSTVRPTTHDVIPPLPMTLPLLTLPQPNKPNDSLSSTTSIFKASSLGASNSSFSGFGNLSVSEASKTSSSAFQFGSTDKSEPRKDADPLANLQKLASGEGQGNVLGSIFRSGLSNENSVDDSAKSIFGGGDKSAEQQKKDSSKSIFGGAKVDSQSPAIQDVPKPIFGGIAAPVFGDANPFGGPKVDLQKSDGKEAPKSIFGGSPSIFGSSNAFGSTKTEGFGGAPAGGFVFGSAISAPVFGQKQPVVSFTDLGKQAAADNEKEKDITSNKTAGVEEKSKDKTEAVPETSTFADLANKAGSTFADLASKPGGTFADLANKAGNDFANLAANSPGTTVGFNKSAGGGFYNLTHQNAFKNFQSSPQTGKNESGTAEGGDDDGDATTDDNYDPHYDPIVELPDEIVVTTGEENETKLYGERAKLYRYDPESKQWKERGVGEIKVLEHPKLQTFRLVMRQEQIHKLVLNMNIFASLQMDNMKDQKNSFLWAGYNYAVDEEGKVGTEGVLERLACRFGKEEIADEFIKTVNSCIERTKALHGDEEDENDDAPEEQESS
ncbi:E3 SUMO-protein ligase RanBP2 [Drosophila santomea]|uniref:E3 SUMO-protein ligase RanBP2 n=1 Tax=Drosophila santomea TaxID=129105 RepID=UPI001953E9B4|nr:E3 SUMO-protein ligase RanBP2 [Drosophila santomea]